MTLTEQPWAVTGAEMARARDQGFGEQQLESAVAVIAMFNYFTRVADATGIDFDYQTPLPAFAPDRAQVSAPRPVVPEAAGQVEGQDAPGQGEGRAPGHDGLRAAWAVWRAYLLDSDEPLSRPDRLLVASVAAGQAGDWATARELGPAANEASHVLAAFAGKLSREPWRMQPADLDRLRASGYPEIAILHAISVIAHQNADSRLSAGLAAIHA